MVLAFSNNRKVNEEIRNSFSGMNLMMQKKSYKKAPKFILGLF